MVVALAIAACSSPEGAVVSRPTKVEAPQRVTAGELVTVVVEATGAGDMSLDVIDAYGITRLTEPLDEGSASFELPARLTQLAGTVTLRVHGVDGDHIDAWMTIGPASAVDPLDIVVGPRTIVADGADETMAVAFVTDRFGNPMPDGTPVDLTLLDERGDATLLEAIVDGGLAARLIRSGTVAQRVEVYAGAADATLASRRVDFNEVAGPARDLTLAVERDDRLDPPLVADGRSLVALRTNVIVDGFGNVVPNGHLVRVRTVGPDGIGRLTSRTIDGIARFAMASPRLPGIVTLVAHADGASSESIELGFGDAVSELPVAWEIDDGSLVASIGPVLDAQRAVVVDGTSVAVSSTGTVDAGPIEAQLIDGRAIIDLGPIAPAHSDVDDVVTAVVFGVSATEEWR